MRRVLRIFLLFIGLLVAFLLSIITIVDYTPYQEMAYYKEMMARLDSVEIIKNDRADTIKAGWSKVSITPENKVPLAGYGARDPMIFKSVHDSVWVRAVVFQSGHKKKALVSADLLVIPPNISRKVYRELEPLGYTKDDVFFSATHSHSSIGAWNDSFIGSLFAGGFDPNVELFIIKAIVQSINKAERKIVYSKQAFAAIDLNNYVLNRLVNEKGTVDPWLRLLKLENAHGETAVLSSFSAHATCLYKDFIQLSGDYPGELNRMLEQDSSIDFSMFTAGAMASMAPEAGKLRRWDKVLHVSTGLYEQIMLINNFLTPGYQFGLGGETIPLELRAPHFKINNRFRIRPWLFNLIFGESSPHISTLKVGKTLFIGMPGDFSGELVGPLEEYGRAKDLNLIITGFNGSYAGYFTKDEWYKLNKYETTTMNWYGPYNGAYLSEITKKLIDIHAEY